MIEWMREIVVFLDLQVPALAKYYEMKNKFVRVCMLFFPSSSSHCLMLNAFILANGIFERMNCRRLSMQMHNCLVMILRWIYYQS